MKKCLFSTYIKMDDIDIIKEEIELFKSSKDGPIYTKEELEAQLEPIACKLPKEECPQGLDIVQVTLPWLDDANDCIEVYLIRKKNGIIELVYD